MNSPQKDTESTVVLISSFAVEHHERQPPITFQRVLPMELDDCFFLPRFQPEITGNPTVVLVDAPYRCNR
jgi:hypothetical protein